MNSNKMCTAVVVVVLVILQSSLIQSHEVVTLHRLLNSKSGNHFYTASIDEATNAVTALHFTYQGIAGSVATSPLDCQLQPVYRLYKSGKRDDHFYTTNDFEATTAAAKFGYTREGIAFYCASAINQCGATLAFNRYLQGRDHLYTTDLTEGHQIAAGGGSFEGIMCYIWP
ncbi:hypothetical protein HA402_000493 [Bradysia odoriphaga]|nr:hypothetical protein HA402_000493 [Bradysia odoriphaga]